MERSVEVTRALEHLYEAVQQGTHEAFDGIVSADDDAMVVGTDRWLGDRRSWREAFPGLRGITVEAGDARGFRDGSCGWAVDRPVFVLPGGGRLPARVSAVVRQEEGGWRIVHVHISVQVPDDVALVDAVRWLAATTP